ncbi:MAG: hypothetical protein U1F43_07875 [Myxococcota bacterium]
MSHRIRRASRSIPCAHALTAALTLAACGDGGGSSDARDGDASVDTAPDVSLEGAPPFPAWVSIEPAADAVDVPRTAWLRLAFASDPSADALAHMRLDCGTGTPAIGVESLGEGAIVVNPDGELPAAAACTLSWRGPSVVESKTFTTAAAGDAAVVPYDREDHARLAPFPDDTWLVADASKPTGRRFQLPTLTREDDVKSLLVALSEVPQTLDGFSPLAPIVVELPATAAPASLPMNERASLDALGTLGLFDVDPASPTYLQRVAFDVVVKEDSNKDQSAAHVLVIFPIAPLAPRGQYAFVVTRRAFVDPTRPLAPSAYTTRVLADATTPSGAALAALAHASPALHADDVALVLRLSIRSLDHAGDDLMAIRAAVLAAPAPTYTITKVTKEASLTSPVAAVVEGTWNAPDWRDGDFLARDDAGHPKATGTRAIKFILALPDSAASAPAPMVMYQHGNPGSAEVEVPGAARGSLAAAGFAVIGFTDIINREIIKGGDVSAYTNAIFQTLLVKHRFPETVALLDTADQLSFIRLLQSLDDLDLLPLDAPDGLPDLDVAAPLAYLGISNGSFRGTGLMPFAPDIHAAALVVGGGRFSCSIVHQENAGPNPSHLYAVVTSLFPHISRADFWVGIALAQMAIDDQDQLTHAPRMYTDRYPLESAARASVLAVEGLGDNFVPTYSTRAAATAMGLTQIDPSPDDAPTLTYGGAGPLSANIDASTTGGFVQYVPAGLAGFTVTPACDHQTEGHFCAQIAAAGIIDRFFLSALDGVPTITP